MTFLGDLTLACEKFFRGKARYRKVDLLEVIQECGPNAVGIVTLISFLVGVILAFMGAVQLSQFGASIYVADLDGIGMVRDMAAMASLAAALAIPFTTANGQPFPDRDLILFLTFAVILVTLVGQGLMLPSVIRALGLAHAGRRERHTDRAEECEARRQAIEASTDRLDQLRAELISWRTSFSRSALCSANGSSRSSTEVTPTTLIEGSPSCTTRSSFC